jgi:hypothetical protein
VYTSFRRLGAVLLAGAALAALPADNALAEGPLKSGPPVGARNNRRGFVPQFVAGPLAGQRRCPV